MLTLSDSSPHRLSYRGNYWNKKRAEPTVYAREKQQLLQAGYRWQGDYLVPPV